MSYIKESCEEFVQRLSSKDPTPGGGGASALAGAVGTALGNMVGSLTVGKKKYQGVEAEIRQMMDQAQTIQRELLALVQQDAEAFAPLAKAYGLPEKTEEEQREKEQVMEAVLRGACQVPLAIMEKCCQGIELCGAFAEKGSVLAISDAGAGASLCSAALQSASLNVYINTKAMKDREYAKQTNQKCDEMLEGYTKKAKAVMDYVFTAIK